MGFAFFALIFSPTLRRERSAKIFLIYVFFLPTFVTPLNQRSQPLHFFGKWGFDRLDFWALERGEIYSGPKKEKK